MVKVSLVIPVYNVEKHLARCLDSCINQSFKDIEIICINDGSTDDSLEILEAYQKFDTRIQIINKKNGGLASARNAGMQKVTGDYILFVDSDDYISSITVDELYKNAIKNNSDIVIFDYLRNDVNTKTINQITIMSLGNKYIDKPFNINTISPEIYKHFHVSTWSKLYRTEFLKQNNINFETMIYEDVPYWTEVYSKAKSITYIQKPFYHYYIGRPGQIMSNNDEKMFDIIKVFQRSIAILKENNHWSRCKHSVEILMIHDFLSKLQLIKPELKEKLFEKYKQLNLNIDYEFYYKSNIIQGEKVLVKHFELLNSSDNFEEFVKKVSEAGNV